MSYYAQYGGIATDIANQYGLDPAIFSGLIDVESSWNPYADAPGSSAYGFTQLLRGTASDLGVNRYDPIANLHGGAQYLQQQLQRFGNYNDALAAYHDGPGNVGGSGGYGYASKVMNAANKYGKPVLETAVGIGRMLAGDPTGASGIFGGMSDLFGGGQDTCGINPFCYLRQWFEESGFVYRLALASLALLLILGGLYLMKG